MSTSAEENTHVDLLAEVRWPPDPDRLTGRVRIDLDDAHAETGSPVTVEARVTTPGPEEVRAVFRVQGLEADWCPPPQAVTVVPGALTRLYVKLSPAAGTPPGRYLWSLTAEALDQPMLAVTAELRVERLRPVAPPARPRRWRLLAVLVTASIVTALVVAAGLTALAPSWLPWGPEPDASPAPSVTTDRARDLLPTTRPSAGSTDAPATTARVRIKGTMLVEDESEPTRISVVQLRLADLTGTDPPSAAGRPELTGTGAKVNGKHWSVSLPPGLYGLTFSKAGYTPESIVVSTAMVGSNPPPQVRLVAIRPTPSATVAP